MECYIDRSGAIRMGERVGSQTMRYFSNSSSLFFEDVFLFSFAPS